MFTIPFDVHKTRYYVVIPFLVLGLFLVLFGSGWLLVWIPCSGTSMALWYWSFWIFYGTRTCAMIVIVECHGVIIHMNNLSVKKSMYGIYLYVHNPSVVCSVYWYWSVNYYFMFTSKFCKLGYLDWWVCFFVFCLFYNYHDGVHLTQTLITKTGFLDPRTSVLTLHWRTHNIPALINTKYSLAQRTSVLILHWLTHNTPWHKRLLSLLCVR